jgi:hypothetical protein
VIVVICESSSQNIGYVDIDNIGDYARYKTKSCLRSDRAVTWFTVCQQHGLCSHQLRGGLYVLFHYI